MHFIPRADPRGAWVAPKLLSQWGRAPSMVVQAWPGTLVDLPGRDHFPQNISLHEIWVSYRSLMFLPPYPLILYTSILPTLKKQSPTHPPLEFWL